MYITYRMIKGADLNRLSGVTTRLAKRVTAALWNNALKMKKLEGFPFFPLCLNAALDTRLIQGKCGS